MLPEPRDDNKIVEGDEIEFDTGAAPAADTLDTKAGGTPSGSTAGTNQADYFVDNMQQLAEKIKLHFSTTGNGINSSQDRLINNLNHDFAEGVTDLLPYLISLDTPSDNFTKIALSPCDPGLLRGFLEQSYGAEVAQTGIYEAIGLDQTDPLGLDALLDYFPELKPVRELDGRGVFVTDNPYQALLTIPVSARGFFTGALIDSGAELTSNLNYEFVRPLGLREILTYAKKVGEIPRVKELMDLYSGKTK